MWPGFPPSLTVGVDLRMAAAIAGSALIAAYPTARFATGLNPHVLRLAFAVFLATIAGTVAYLTWRGGARGKRGPRRAWGWVIIVGVIGGVVSGFFGVGGAFIAPPLLTTFFGLRQLEAQGLGPGARVPERIHCVAGLCRGRSGRLGCRITACAWWNGRDLRWSRVCQPPARKTDAFGVLRTLAAYRGAAGAAGVIEVGYGFEVCAGRIISQGMRNLAESFSQRRTRKTDMSRLLVALAAAAALLACSAAPSFADHHGGGMAWHGSAGGWHGGGGNPSGAGWHGAGAGWHNAGGGWHGGGGNWNGGNWHGGGGGWHHGGHGGGWGVGPAIGLGLGLGLLGGALATAPYYSGYDYGYGYAPYAGTPAPRFGIGAIPIRAITLRYPNARFLGDKLFSNL